MSNDPSRNQRPRPYTHWSSDEAFLGFVRDAGVTLPSDRPRSSVAPPPPPPPPLRPSYSASQATTTHTPAGDPRSDSAERKRRYTGGEPAARRQYRPPGHFLQTPFNSSSSMEAGGSQNTPIDLTSPDASTGLALPPQTTFRRLPESISSNMNSRAAFDRPYGRRESGDMALPPWQPDHTVTKCPVCETDFSILYRRHHCRKCGRVVCARCSPHRITIPRQYIVQPPNPYADDEANTTAAASPFSTANNRVNPALGGGEIVRVCNPCVPDPWTPPPPHAQSLSSATNRNLAQSAIDNNRNSNYDSSVVNNSLQTTPPGQPPPLPSWLRPLDQGPPPPQTWRGSSLSSSSSLPTNTRNDRSQPALPTMPSRPNRDPAEQPGLFNRHAAPHERAASVRERLEARMAQLQSDIASDPDHQMRRRSYVRRSHVAPNNPVQPNSIVLPGNGQYGYDFGRDQGEHYQGALQRFQERRMQHQEMQQPSQHLPGARLERRQRPVQSSSLDLNPDRYLHAMPNYPTSPTIRGPPRDHQAEQPRLPRQIHEEDACPVCHEELPRGGEDVREAHVRDCISTRFSSTPTQRTTQLGASTPPSRPGEAPEASRSRAMSTRVPGFLKFVANEKHCTDQNGDPKECIICFEEFLPGDNLATMECLCVFHLHCIRSWWQTKGAGNCPTHRLYE